MKIYEIATGYTPIPAKIGAATEIVVEELTRAYRKQGIEATIIDIAASDRLQTELPIIEVAVPKGFSRTDEKLGLMHKLKRVVYSISLAECIKRIIRLNKERLLLHFHNQYNLYFFLKLSTKKIRSKCIVFYTNHSYIWHGDWNDIESIVKKRYFQEISSMEGADKVFVLNEVALENIVYHVGIEKNKISLIDNGVNTNVYKPLQNKEEIRKKNGLKGKIVFIQVGSVCERKNQLGAIELLLPLMKQHEGIEFCYAGGLIDVEYNERISRFAEDRGIGNRVHYFGEIKPGKELNEFYNLGDAMLFPSKAEGFSLVILEAMSAGVPVLINRKLRFKLADSCLQYDSEDDFHNVVMRHIYDIEKQKEISASNRSLIEKEFSWDAIAKEYYKAYEV